MNSSLAVQTGEINVENRTLPGPFAHIDQDTGRFVYAPGESEETVFPGEWTLHYSDKFLPKALSWAQNIVHVCMYIL